MNTVSLQELQRDPAALLNRVEAGVQLEILRDGRSVAELRPIVSAGPAARPFGLAARAFVVPNDFVAPLPEDGQPELEGR